MELEQWKCISAHLLPKELIPRGDSVVSPRQTVRSDCNFGFSMVSGLGLCGVESIEEKMQSGVQEYLQQL